MSATLPRRLWTYDDIETEVGIKAASARWYRHKGEFAPAIVIGSRVYFDPQDVIDWVNSHREGGPRHEHP